VPNVSLALKETCSVFSVLWSICIAGVYRKGWLSFTTCLFISRELRSVGIWFESLVEYINTSINNQHYALNYITSLFNIQTPTCFGISLPSSGSFLVPCELLEIQNK
jgi:hypothetical protein